MKIFVALLPAVLCIFAYSAQARVELHQAIPDNSILSVDIRDLAQFSSAQLPQAAVLVEDMRRASQKYFPADVTKIYGVELNALPQVAQDGSSQLSITALVKTTSEGSFFRKMKVNFTAAPISVASVENIGADIPLNRVSFSIQASLIDRKFIIESKEYGIKKVYPIGVGGFDDGISAGSRGQTHLVTPTFENATINRGTAIAARTDPAYYKGKPFMPITTARGTTTSIAFHIEVNNSFVRGYDSHGCMRVREKDLIELYYMLMQGASSSIPVNVSYFISDSADHPAPKVNDSYQAYKNFGTKSKPEVRRDNHNLVIMEKRQSSPLPLLEQMGF